jgi:hypothetical protein
LQFFLSSQIISIRVLEIKFGIFTGLQTLFQLTHVSIMQDQDEDAMLLAEQFCTYSFSSILEESRNDVPYSFYAR